MSQPEGSGNRVGDYDKLSLSDYQKQAKETVQYKLEENEDVVPPLLGLANETGAILNVYKKYLRDQLDDLAPYRGFLKTELGDLLWYLSTVATALKLDLGEIAKDNLDRTRDRYAIGDEATRLAALPGFDDTYPDRERFPNRLVVQFTQKTLPSDELVAHLTLVSADPNAFPNGPIVINNKNVGFQIGNQIGETLNDNSRYRDGYRFHDAIHMGFLAVLRWSPIFRELLQLKRRSDPTTDKAEDGARAKFTEEGIAAVLARLAERRNSFQKEANIDGDALVVVKAATVGLEVEPLPGWLWRRAINQGFVAMQKLIENGGGYLIADLKVRNLEYRKEME